MEKRRKKIEMLNELRRLGGRQPSKPSKPDTHERAKKRARKAKHEEYVTEKHSELLDFYESASKEFQKVENSVQLSKERIPALRVQIEKLKYRLKTIDGVIRVFKDLACYY